MGRTKGKTMCVESYLISNLQISNHFYSDKEDKQLTAIATYFNRKITTERLIAVKTGKETSSKYITKVTIL